MKILYNKIIQQQGCQMCSNRLDSTRTHIDSPQGLGSILDGLEHPGICSSYLLFSEFIVEIQNLGVHVITNYVHMMKM